MLKAFLFDLDETLIDRTASVELFVKDQYLRSGLDKQYAYEAYRNRFMELDQNGYGDKKTLFQTLQNEFNLSPTVEELIADFYSKAWVNCQIFADTPGTLKRLRERGYKLGIVTNGSSRSQRAKIAGTHLTNLVDTILVSGEEEIQKPNAEIFLRAARRLDVPVKQCVFIGDNPQTDIVGARHVGMTTVWVKRHLNWSDNLGFSPDYQINSLGELFQIQF